jgi:hypothetical protein
MNHSEKIYGSENRFAGDIGTAIAREIYPGAGSRSPARLIGYDRDYWSVILVYEITGEEPPGKVCRIYCKIPKANWNITTIGGILTDDFESSKEMAEAEFNSLTHLHADFERCPDRSLRVINPLGYLPEYNAIFTEGVDNSAEVFELLRPWGNRSRINGESLLHIRKIGKWLGFLHTVGAERGANGFEDTAPFSDQVNRMKDTVEKRTDAALADGLRKYPEKLLEKAGLATSAQDTLTVEGFELRNFITDGAAVFFLDPGQMLRGSAYEDLARFVASLSLLYWGRIDFLRDYRNEEIFTTSFLESYEDVRGGIDRDILNPYLAKQYIRLWLDGLMVLRHKRYIKPLGSIVQRVYLERFFSRRLDNILQAV